VAASTTLARDDPGAPLGQSRPPGRRARRLPGLGEGPALFDLTVLVAPTVDPTGTGSPIDLAPTGHASGGPGQGLAPDLGNFLAAFDAERLAGPHGELRPRAFHRVGDAIVDPILNRPIPRPPARHALHPDCHCIDTGVLRSGSRVPRGGDNGFGPEGEGRVLAPAMSEADIRA
jgi:hypothetical protein